MSAIQLWHLNCRYFIFLSWMPSYFNKVQGLDLRASSLSAFIPWLALAICSSAGGLLADRLLARGVPVADVRKRLQSVAFLVPAAMLLVLARPHVSTGLAVTCMTIALGATSASAWPTALFLGHMPEQTEAEPCKSWL